MTSNETANEFESVKTSCSTCQDDAIEFCCGEYFCENHLMRHDDNVAQRMECEDE